MAQSSCEVIPRIERTIGIQANTVGINIIAYRSLIKVKIKRHPLKSCEYFHSALNLTGINSELLQV
jgi:hypothetical protein